MTSALEGTSHWIWVLKLQLATVSEERRAVLLNYLPQHIIELLNTYSSPPPSDRSHERYTPNGTKSLFSMVHWSWFLKILEHWTKEEQKLFLAILPQQTRRRLNQEIGLPPLPATPLRSKLQKFLKAELMRYMAHDLLPLSFLPSSPLNVLLNLSKRELIHLIDLVALFDLSVELKQIVETKILQKIYSYLSEAEKKFVKTLSPPLTTHTFLSMRLGEWSGTKESFRHLLHKRGLARMGCALSGESSDLHWYLAHLLDIGRGTLLLKTAATPIGETMRAEILSQVLTALSWKQEQEI